MITAHTLGPVIDISTLANQIIPTKAKPVSRFALVARANQLARPQIRIAFIHKAKATAVVVVFKHKQTQKS